MTGRRAGPVAPRAALRAESEGWHAHAPVPAPPPTIISQLNSLNGLAAEIEKRVNDLYLALASSDSPGVAVPPAQNGVGRNY